MSDESDEEDCLAIVIDNGSGTIKAGFAGDDAPRAVFPTMIGRPRVRERMVGSNTNDMYVGDEAQIKRGILSLNYPIECGVIKNWDNMEKIWHHIYYHELRVAPEDQLILFADNTISPQHREKMAQIMFETFNVPGLYISLQAVLSLTASGRTHGVILDSGYGVTNVVPIYEGHAIPNAIERMEFGGFEITEYLWKLHTELGVSIGGTCEREVFNDMKEKLCYVTLDFDKEMKSSEDNMSLNREYKLPDGQVINIGNAKFRAPEALFLPTLLGLDTSGIHECIYNSIIKCDPGVQTEMFRNIVLSGGNTMFGGISERLKKEMQQLAPTEYVAVIGAPERKYSSWIGGSICAGLSNTMDGKWITKEKYDEYGPEIIRQLSSIN